MPGVQAVIGPAQVSRAVAPLREAGSAARRRRRSGPLAQLGTARPQPGPRRRRASPSCATGSRRRATAPACWPRARAGPRRARGALAAGLGQATAGSERRGRRPATVRRRAPAASAGAQHRAALGRPAAEVRPAEPRPRTCAATRCAARASCRSRSNQDAHDNAAAAAGARRRTPNAQLKTALQQLEGDDGRQVRPELRRGAGGGPPGAGRGQRHRPGQRRAYAPGYAGLPAELAALQARLVEDAEEAKRGHRLAGLRRSSSSKQLSSGDGAALRRPRQARRRAARSSPTAPPGSPAPPPASETASAASAPARPRLAGRHLPARRRRRRRSSENLADGFSRSHPLQAGLRRATVRVARPATRPLTPAGAAPARASAGHLRLRLLRPLGPRRRPAAAARARRRRRST